MNDEVAREQQHRQRRDEERLLRRRPVRAEPQDVSAVERSGDDDAVDDDLDEAPPVDDERAQEALAPLRALCLAAVDVGEEACELDDQRERQQRRRSP